MRTKLFAAGLALLIFGLLPLPSQAQYGGGWKYMLVRTLGPPLINRGINYFMSRRGHVFDGPEQERSSPPPSYNSYSPPRTYAPRTAQRRTAVSHSVPPSNSHQSSGSSSRTAKLEVPPPPKMLVPPPPPGVPTGAVLGMYPSDMNKLAGDVPPPPKIDQAPHKKAQQ
jgi:hypothetical protein